MTTMPTDTNNNPIQAFRWGTPQFLRVDDLPAISTPFASDVQIIYVLSTAPFRFRLGNGETVRDTDNWIPAGVLVPLRIYAGETISVKQFGDDTGQIQITELK